MKNLLKMSDLSPAELTHVLDVADQLKAQQKLGGTAPLLAGKTVWYTSPWAIAGTPPAGVAEAEEPSGADFALTLTPQGNALHLIPRIGVLGVGCKRGTTAAQLEARLEQYLADLQ